MLGEHRRPEFLKINPAGKLPVLVDGDTVLTESIAIVTYLAEKYPEKKLIPTELPQKAQAYRWLLFAATELEQPLWRITRHTNPYPEAKRLPADIVMARQDFPADGGPRSTSICGGASSSWVIAQRLPISSPRIRSIGHLLADPKPTE